MRRLIVLVALVLLMAAMLVVSAGAAQAVGRVPFGPNGGVAVPPAVCTVLVEENDQESYEWRPGERVCWANSPVHDIFSVVSR